MADQPLLALPPSPPDLMRVLFLGFLYSPRLKILFSVPFFQHERGDLLFLSVDVVCVAFLFFFLQSSVDRTF